MAWVRISFIISLFFVSIWGYSQHTIVFKNGEKREGVVMELRYDTLTYIYNRTVLKAPLIQISSVFFNEFIPYDGKLLKTEQEKIVHSGNYIIRYQLREREITTIPKISIGTEDKGTVVVTITVDRYGNVVKAEPGAVGSTTSSAYLYAKAQFAAMEAKFSQHMTGPIKTEGTLTITY